MERFKCTIKNFSFFAIVIACFLLFLTPTSAAINNQINYQGKLLDGAGNAVADGTYNMHFRLCSDSVCTAAVFDEAYVGANKVAVTNGLFSVMIGSVSSTLDSVDFNRVLYLEVNIGGTSTPAFEMLLPRKILGSVPNAFNAQKLDGLASSSLAVLTRANTYTATNTFNDLIIEIGKGINLGGVYRLTWPSVGGGAGGSFWATSSDGLIGYPDLAGNFSIIIGAAATTTGDTDPLMRLKVAGNTKLAGDLRVAGNSTTTGFSTLASTTIAGNLNVFGKIGIGTNNPGVALDVAGSVRVSAGDAYWLDDRIIAQASTTLYNYYFGNSGNSSTTGNSNTGVGQRSLIYNETGYLNTAIGAGASQGNIDGNENTAVGALALYNNLHGSFNVAMGYGAMYWNASSSGNTAIGFQAGYGTTTSLNHSNTMIGYQSGLSLTTGNSNNLLGIQSGFYLTSGSNNLMLGDGAGYYLVSGSNNILLGSGVNALTTTTSNYLNIGNVLYGNLLSGNIGIGTNAPQSALHVVGTSTLSGNLVVSGVSSLATTTLGYGSVIGANSNYITFNKRAINGSMAPYQSSYFYNAVASQTQKFVNTFEYGVAVSNNIDNGGDSLFTIINNYSSTTGIHTLNFSELVYNEATSTNFVFGGNVEVKNNLSFSGSLQKVADNLLLPHKLRNIYIADNYAYTMTYATNSIDSFRIVDISNPQQPRVVGGAGMTGLPLSDGKRVWASGDYAYVLYNATGGIDNPFRIIDISDKSNPVVVGGADLKMAGFMGSAGQPFYVSGRYAYIMGNANMYIVDISNPYKPKAISSLNDVGATNWDVKVTGDYAYVCSRKIINGEANPLTIVNVKDKNNPYIVKELVIPDLATSTNLCWSLDVSGAHVYLGLGTLGSNSSTESFRIVDVSDPNNPLVEGGSDIGTNTNPDLELTETYTAFNYIKVLGTRLYATTWRNDFLVIDISSSTKPNIISKSSVFGGSTNSNPLTFDLKGQYVAIGYAPILTEYLPSTDYFRIYKLPGADIWGGHADAFSAGSLQVLNNAVFNQRLTVWDGLEVGSGGIYSGGGITGSKNFSTSTFDYSSIMQSNITASTFDLLGQGSSSTKLNVGVYGYSTSTDYNLTGDTGAIGVLGVSNYLGVLGLGNIGGYFIGSSTGIYAATTNNSAQASAFIASGANSTAGYFEIQGTNSTALDLSGNGQTNSKGINIDNFTYAIYSNNGFNYFGGNVGIGTTTPQKELTVVGNAYISGTTTASCFTVDGINCLGGGTSQWQNSGSNIYFNTGRVGIATTSLLYGLTVATSSLMRDILPETNLTYSLGSSVARWDNLWVKTINVGTSTWSIGPTSNGSLAFYDSPLQGGNIRLFVASSTGFVGIGTTTPGYGLTVANTSYFGATSTFADYVTITRGNIAASAINIQTAATTSSFVDADQLLIYSASAGVNKNISKANFVAGVGASISLKDLADTSITKQATTNIVDDNFESGSFSNWGANHDYCGAHFATSTAFNHTSGGGISLTNGGANNGVCDGYYIKPGINIVGGVTYHVSIWVYPVTYGATSMSFSVFKVNVGGVDYDLIPQVATTSLTFNTWNNIVGDFTPATSDVNATFTFVHQQVTNLYFDDATIGGQTYPLGTVLAFNGSDWVNTTTISLVTSQTANNSIFDMLTMKYRTTQTYGANGLGVGSRIMAVNSTGTDKTILYQKAEYTSVTNGNESSKVTWQTLQGGSLFDNLVLNAGNVGIGTSTPAYTLQVYVSSTGAQGHVATDGTWSNTSDSKLKTNTSTIDNALALVLGLKPVRFDWISNSVGSTGVGKQIGFIAQDVEQIIPGLVDTDPSGMKSLSYAMFAPLLAGAIKQQQTQIDDISQLINSNFGLTASSSSLVVSELNLGDDNLKVTSQATFYGTITVIGAAGFKSTVTFEKDVNFKGKIYVNKDSAGEAIIAAGTTTVEILFTEPYVSTPRIVANISASGTPTFINYNIINKTKASFSIVLERVLTGDVYFDWIAVGSIEVEASAAAPFLISSMPEPVIIIPDVEGETSTSASTTPANPVTDTASTTTPSAPDVSVSSPPASSESPAAVTAPIAIEPPVVVAPLVIPEPPVVESPSEQYSNHLNQRLIMSLLTIEAYRPKKNRTKIALSLIWLVLPVVIFIAWAI